MNVPSAKLPQQIANSGVSGGPGGSKQGGDARRPSANNYKRDCNRKGQSNRMLNLMSTMHELGVIRKHDHVAGAERNQKRESYKPKTLGNRMALFGSAHL